MGHYVRTIANDVGGELGGLVSDLACVLIVPKGET
jgi:hypothetical protein